MSRFLIASAKYHNTHKTAGSKKQISEATSAAAKCDPSIQRNRVRTPRSASSSSSSSTWAAVDHEAKGHIKLHNPETGRDEWFLTQEDADISAYWFNLFEQDKREKIRLEELRRDAKRAMDEAVKIKKLKDSVPLVIERNMVGVIASLEGIRCYHYDKTKETGMTNCDCTKVSPGVFVVAAHHQPGTFYLDDSKVQRQIEVMEANQALSGKSTVLNPGGWGQPISKKNHIRMATVARQVTQQPGSL